MSATPLPRGAAGQRFHLPSLSPAQVLVIGFAILILTGTGLLALPAASVTGKSVGLVNALFTATSAVCVTGLVVLDTAKDWTPFGQAVILLLIQAGALGIAILSTSVSLVTGRRISLRGRVVLQESLGQFSHAGVVRLTKTILKVTFLIEGIGALLLFLRFIWIYPPGQAAWLAVFHAISAFCNAGFDLFSTSLRGYATDPVVTLTVATLIILGGIGFVVIHETWRNRFAWSRLSLHTRLVVATTGLLLGAGTVLFLALEWANPDTLGALNPLARPMAAFFTALTPRTAGFEVIATGQMTQASLLLILVFMFIGASPGGTGGGIKTTSFATVGLMIWSTIRGQEQVEVGGRRLPGDLIRKAWVIAAIALGWLVMATVVLLVTEGQEFMPILFETTSAFGTVGLSTGVTPQLTGAGKLVLSLVMYSGRIGPLTLAIALASRRPRAPVDFPDERVMIG